MISCVTCNFCCTKCVGCGTNSHIASNPENSIVLWFAWWLRNYARCSSSRNLCQGARLLLVESNAQVPSLSRQIACCLKPQVVAANPKLNSNRQAKQAMGPRGAFLGREAPSRWWDWFPPSGWWTVCSSRAQYCGVWWHKCNAMGDSRARFIQIQHGEDAQGCIFVVCTTKAFLQSHSTGNVASLHAQRGAEGAVFLKLICVTFDSISCTVAGQLYGILTRERQWTKCAV